MKSTVLGQWECVGGFQSSYIYGAGYGAVVEAAGEFLGFSGVLKLILLLVSDSLQVIQWFLGVLRCSVSSDRKIIRFSGQKLK